MVDWIVSPSSSPDTSESDSVYVVLGVACGFCLLLVVLWVAVCVQNGTLKAFYRYAGTHGFKSSMKPDLFTVVYYFVLYSRHNS